MKIQLLDTKGEHYYWADILLEDHCRVKYLLLNGKVFQKWKANKYQQVHISSLKRLVKARKESELKEKPTA